MVDINAAQDPTKMEKSKPPFLGPALAGFCGLLIGVGLGRFGYPPLIPAMVEANWGAPAAFHLAGAFNLAGYVVGAIVAVPIISRLGTKQSLWLGAVMATAAFAVSIVPLPAWLFSAARALSGIAGGILMIILPPIISASVAPESKGRANGIAFAGVGTGFVLSGTALPALAGLGPSAAWLGLTIVMIAASMVLLVTVPNVEARPVQSGPPVLDRGWQKKPAFIGLAAAYGAAGAGYVPHTIIFVDHVARDLGHGLAVGGLIWTITGLTAVAAPLVAGVVADRFGFAWALRVILGLMALGACIPAFTSMLLPLLLSSMLCGGLMIGLGSLAAGRTREIVGADAHAPAWAAQTVLFAVAQALAAYATTATLAATGNHALVFAVAGLIMAAGLAVDLALSRRN